MPRPAVPGSRVSWPGWRGLLAVGVCGGVGWSVLSALEGWGAWSGIYFGSITALTIGYGDLVPASPGTRIAAVAIGLMGVLMTAILAGIAVTAMQVAVGKESHEDQR